MFTLAQFLPCRLCTMQASGTGAIAIANYDFRSSGTVAKSIQIACAAHAAGLPAELWVARARGPLLARVPDSLPVVEAGAAFDLPGRMADLAASVPAFARQLRLRRPAVLLSGGNHFHLAARAALAFSGRRASTRFGLRVSNSSRHGQGDAGRPGAFKYGGADFVTAVSADLAREVSAQVPGLTVSCIPNGCDVAAVRRLAALPAQHPFLDGSAPVISAMGRVVPQKGFDDLVRALAMLRQDVQARLLVIGSGPATNVAALRRLASSQGVGDAVDFVGHQDNPFALIARTQLFACSSRWEGSCNALLEALACGVPVVATDCPTGNAEMLLDGRLGALATPRSPSSLAAAMRRELACERPPVEREEQLERLDMQRCLAGWCTLLEKQWRLVDAVGDPPAGLAQLAGRG